MNSRDFCYWLQGHFEIGGETKPLTVDQVDVIKKHLAMVFVHDIDPSMGPPDHQKLLTEIHTGTPKPQLHGTGVSGSPQKTELYRC